MESFIALATQRRSIRKYQQRPVEPEKTDLILSAALMTPTSKNLREWEFYVTDEAAALQTLAGCRTYGSSMLREAPLAIAVACDASETDTWQSDGAIAAYQMLLCVEDIGLGGCWVQVYGREGAEELVKSVLHIPEHLTVLCLVAIGYKNEEKRPHNTEKLLREKIHYPTHDTKENASQQA